MKQTVTEHMFREAFRSIRPENFSHEGLSALWDFYCSLEDDTGEDVELDVIAICCDWCEYSSIEELRDAFGDTDNLGEPDDQQFLEDLRDQCGYVLEAGNGYLVCN